MSSIAPPDAGRPPFVCDWATAGSNGAVVRIAGELDLATSHHLDRTLRVAQQHRRDVVLDLRGLQFMDCVGLRALKDGQGRADRDGSRLTIVCGTPGVARLVTLTGADELTLVAPDRLEPPVQALLALVAG